MIDRSAPLRPALLAFLITVVLALPCSFASAHTRSLSTSMWTLEPHGAVIQLRLAELDRQVLAAEDDVGPVLHPALAAVTVTAAGQPCRADPTSVREEVVDTGWRRTTWRVDCGGAVPDEARIDRLFDAIPRHVHFAVVRRAGARTEQVLTDGAREIALSARPPATLPEAVAWYVVLGVEHILSGWDHLVFILVLLVAAPTRKALITSVSGFTVGHSAALILAALGLVVFDRTVVEAFIGASIALLAVEVVASLPSSSPRIPAATAAALGFAAVAAALWRPALVMPLVGLAIFVGCFLPLARRAERPERLRALVVTMFGVGHGLGFASGLAEPGTSTERVVIGVLGFNGGVELGQLAVVIALWPVLAWARRQPWWEADRVVVPAMAVAVAVGTALFVWRGWG